MTAVKVQLRESERINLSGLRVGRRRHSSAEVVLGHREVVDAIPVYQLHAPDDDVPFADSIGELARLERLHLSGNRLTSLPASFSRLQSLRILSLMAIHFVLIIQIG